MRRATSHPCRCAGLAGSSQNAARTCPPAGSCETSTKTLETWLERWPKRKRSSNPAAIASASRCCSLTSSASSGSAVFVCAAHARHRTSSRSQPSPRTCAGSPSSLPDRRHCPRCALRKRRVRQCRCVQAAAPSGARGNQGCTTAPPAGFAQSRADFCNKIGTDRQFAAVQRFRQECEGRADEEWTQFKRRS